MASQITQLRPTDWDTLVRRIGQQKVTPIIGAGACAKILPAGRELAEQLAMKYDYPLPDRTDLARVTQYASLTEDDSVAPKEEVVRALKQRADSAGAIRGDGPHALLADLKLPLYITTNYDDLMSRALRDRHGIEPRIEVPRWRTADGPFSSAPSSVTGGPTTTVYHLHGHWNDEQSMVLTEDDYLNFMIKLGRVGHQIKDGSSDATAFLPTRILNALTGTCLMFVGYSMADWNFRILLRGLAGTIPSGSAYPSIAVQLPPDGMSDAQRENVQKYLVEYLGRLGGLSFKIYWGDVYDFTAELRQRLAAATAGPGAMAVHP